MCPENVSYKTIQISLIKHNLVVYSVKVLRGVMYIASRICMYSLVHDTDSLNIAPWCY